MTWGLDHVFVLTSEGAPAADVLAALGFSKGSRNRHAGQGTANRQFFFRNAMLELLWVHDEDAARSAPIAQTHLWERSRYLETGASPFGICLRAEAGDTSPLPFPTWSFRPPYLPPGMEIAVAEAGSDAEPMLFAIPFGGRPDRYPAERQEPLDHPNGVRDLTAVRVTLPDGSISSPVLQSIERLGLAMFTPGSEPCLELAFDSCRHGESADLRPGLPLILLW